MLENYNYFSLLIEVTVEHVSETLKVSYKELLSGVEGHPMAREISCNPSLIMISTNYLSLKMSWLIICGYGHIWESLYTCVVS